MHEIGPVTDRIAHMRELIRDRVTYDVCSQMNCRVEDFELIVGNFASSDMLKDAQVHPDAHRDMVVRIAGFSAYFVELRKGLQNDVIKRTELDLV